MEIWYYLVESNDKKIWTSTEFRYFDEKHERACFVHTKNQQETKLRAKTMPAALLHRISLEKDKVDLELLLNYFSQKIRGPSHKVWEQKRERIYHEKKRRSGRKASTRTRNLISERHNNLH